ncbi:MAG TPA: DUF3180 domain-containing protein [Nocardioidaceae bacterium]|nr:DUF3180 domain-containing protein [Nocardioidaceae bacterium]
MTQQPGRGGLGRGQPGGRRPGGGRPGGGQPGGRRPGGEEPGRLHPTRLRTLFAVAAAGLVLGWFGVPLLRQTAGSVPAVPWTSVGTLMFAAAVLGGMAWQTWWRLQRNRRWMDPQRAVNFLVLAKASIVVGALVAGGYTGYGLHYVDDLAYDAPAQRALRSGLAVVAGVLIVAAASWLERACKVPESPDDSDDDADSDRGESGRRTR